jgi:Pectate lyase superfamily protein
MRIDKRAIVIAVGLTLLASQAEALTFKRSDATYAAPTGPEVNLTQSGTGATVRTLASKLAEWVSVTDFGADPTGVADSTTAVANAYNRVAAMGGGTLYFPPGTFSMTAMPTIAQNGVTVQCSGASVNGGTRLSQTSTSGDFLTITGAHDWVKDCYFAPSAIVTSGYQIKFSGSYHPGLSNVRIDYAYNGVDILSTSEAHIKDISLRYMLGVNGVTMEGTVSVASYGVTISDYIADNPYPISYGASYSTFKTWATGTSYSLGDVIHNNGALYVCTTAGTSAGAGTGPSGLPAGVTSPPLAFSTDIVDNTAHWQFVSREISWLVAGNYTYSLRVNNSSLLEGYIGLRTSDVANTGTSYPKFLEINDLETDHNYTDSVSLAAGVQVSVVNGWFGSSLTGNGLSTAAAFKGMLSMTNTRIMGNALNGIVIAGGVENLISNSWVTTNSVAGLGSHDGISVAAGVTRFVLSGNYLGKDADVATNYQRYGVIVNTGGSDYYTIVNNICAAENATGCVSDSGTGVNKTVTGNH